MSNKVLTLKNIFKQYNQSSVIVSVLDTINLTIHKEEFIAVIGSSGSGKSTLLHIAGLLDTPTSGEEIITSEYHQKNHLVRLHHIGFIYQQPHLLKDFAVFENVLMPRSIIGGSKKEAKEDATEILASLGLAT